MAAAALMDTHKLCVHTFTTKPLQIEACLDLYSAVGVKGITVWRNVLEGKNPKAVGQQIRNSGLEIVSLCRGGFFPATTADKRKANIEENIQIIEEAAALGAPMVVLVVGADPGQSLVESRQQIQDGIAAILDVAKACNVKLAIEPLHPMYADSRSAVNTMQQANDMCDALDSDYVGVAVDVYHLWWDPNLETEIKRCGEAKRIFAFHICDWKTPTEDLLTDRGLMGEGCIDIRGIRGWVEDAGFSGFNEVEIFSTKYWAMDQAEYLQKIKDAYLQHS